MDKQSVRRKLLLTLIIIAVSSIAALAFRLYNQHRFHVERQTRFMMDTFVNIYAVGPKKITSQAIKSAFERMQEIEAKFNPLNPKGIIYAFNHYGTPIEDPEVLGVVRIALEIAHTTGGAFDITVGPLIELWGFYGESPSLPSDKDIKLCLSSIGYRHLKIENGKLEKDQESVRIDLGGIAKGYAISQAVIVLRNQGVISALIDAGGDIYALGKRAGDLWKVGIKNPRDEGILGFLEVEDLSVMGSGDYHRFFFENGKRYHHIFNPATGYPTEGLTATTLIYPDPTAADAWNTAIFVLGPEKGLSVVENMPDMEAVMVTSSGKILYSSGLRESLHITSD